MPEERNWFGKASIINGIFARILGVPLIAIFLSIIAVVLGILGISKSKKMNGEGYKSSLVGLIIGVIGIIWDAFLLYAFI